MCNACKEAYWRLGADSSLNPEPSEIARAQYRRHVAAGTVPRVLPEWLRGHLAANTVKPFKPDYRQMTHDGRV